MSLNASSSSPVSATSLGPRACKKSPYSIPRARRVRPFCPCSPAVHPSARRIYLGRPRLSRTQYPQRLRKNLLRCQQRLSCFVPVIARQRLVFPIELLWQLNPLCGVDAPSSSAYLSSGLFLRPRQQNAIRRTWRRDPGRWGAEGATHGRCCFFIASMVFERRPAVVTVMPLLSR